MIATRRFCFIYLYVLVMLYNLQMSIGQAEIKDRSSYLCKPTAMPHKSHFMGLSAPTDLDRWNVAQDMACNGSLLLLQQVHKAIHSVRDVYQPDKQFRWTHHIADLFLVNGMGFSELNKFVGESAPIVAFGKREFAQPNYKGMMTTWKAFNPKNVGLFDGTIPKPFVGIGAMDENWGWLSTNFLNRCVTNNDDK
jgi:hypothetical protein